MDKFENLRAQIEKLRDDLTKDIEFLKTERFYLEREERIASSAEENAFKQVIFHINKILLSTQS